MYAYTRACMHACMHGCMDGWMDGWMHVCMYACMHVGMHACMYVCMYVMCCTMGHPWQVQLLLPPVVAHMRVHNTFPIDVCKAHGSK